VPATATQARRRRTSQPAAGIRVACGIVSALLRVPLAPLGTATLPRCTPWARDERLLGHEATSVGAHRATGPDRRGLGHRNGHLLRVAHRPARQSATLPGRNGIIAPRPGSCEYVGSWTRSTPAAGLARHPWQPKGGRWRGRHARAPIRASRLREDPGAESQRHSPPVRLECGAPFVRWLPSTTPETRGRMEWAS
jgi:hypothetical protein